MEIAILLIALVGTFFSVAAYVRMMRTAGASESKLLRTALEHQLRAIADEQAARLSTELRAMRMEMNEALQHSMRSSAEIQAGAQRQAAQTQSVRLRELNEQLSQRQQQLERTIHTQLEAVQKAVDARLLSIEQRFHNSALETEQRLENIRMTMEARLNAMQASNEGRLEEMRRTVDETLQQTLEKTLHQSFSRVSEQLESVYRGLGEMQSLATGVGDLKRVLSNVKTRGILGEIQLGAILQQILSPGQYAENIATVPGSSERVEYAVRLPGEGDRAGVWLPVDAKFPSDAYSALLDAYDSADSAAVQAAAKKLEQRICVFARDISSKYLHVPQTTDFAIMFLPAEGLYAEVVRLGMVERLQNEYRVMIAGPTTMAALLNSLQMGFRTLALQKRSGEVWQVLGAVKTEFDKFGAVLAGAQSRIEQVGSELEKLVGTRTRQIQRRLKSITSLSDEELTALPHNKGQESKDNAE